MSDLWRLSAAETARLVRAGDLRARDVAEAALARLDAVNPKINAVVARTDDEALAAADSVDASCAFTAADTITIEAFCCAIFCSCATAAWLPGV